MVAGVKDLAKDWQGTSSRSGTRVSSARDARPPSRAIWPEGGSGFDFQAAFGRPVKLINDAAMQALGSYRGGAMLFLGLGTGLGSALVVGGTVVPLELGHLSVGKKTFETISVPAGSSGSAEEVQQRVEAVTERFVSALLLDDVVLGGGNAKRLTRLPQACRLGDNANASSAASGSGGCEEVSTKPTPLAGRARRGRRSRPTPGHA